ncbi:unnamed protein product [Cunninghamella blakesleeana]
MSDNDTTIGVVSGACLLLFLVIPGAIELAFSVPNLNNTFSTVCDVENLPISVITKLFVASGALLVASGGLMICAGCGLGLWLGAGNTYAFAVAIVGTVWYSLLKPACAEQFPQLTQRYLGIIIINYIYSVGLPVLVAALVCVGGVSVATIAAVFGVFSDK